MVIQSRKREIEQRGSPSYAPVIAPPLYQLPAAHVPARRRRLRQRLPFIIR